VKNKQHIIAKFLIFITVTLWLYDRTTGALSTFLGQIIYKDTYMQSVNGYVGDMSNGFNIDMHLSLILIIMFLIGIVLYKYSK